MIKKLTSFLDYGVFAEIAVAIFAVVFIAIVIRTLLIGQQTSRKNSLIVFNDKEESIV